MEKDQREALLEAGVRVVHARGLAATGFGTLRSRRACRRARSPTTSARRRRSGSWSSIAMPRGSTPSCTRRWATTRARRRSGLGPISIGSRRQPLRPSGGADAWFPILRVRSPSR